MTPRRPRSSPQCPGLLTSAQVLTVETLAHQFYAVVPLEYRTYCAFTARIAHAALRGLGLDAELLACQMWCVTPQENYVVGFLEGCATGPGRWNGHVVCRAGNFFLDAAVCNFERDFRLPVPTVVYGRTFGDSTNVIARVDIANASQLWWHRPPAGADARVPDAPAPQVQALADRLIARVRERLLSCGAASVPSSPLAIVTRPGVAPPEAVPQGAGPMAPAPSWRTA